MCIALNNEKHDLRGSTCPVRKFLGVNFALPNMLSTTPTGHNIPFSESCSLHNEVEAYIAQFISDLTIKSAAASNVSICTHCVGCML